MVAEDGRCSDVCVMPKHSLGALQAIAAFLPPTSRLRVNVSSLIMARLLSNDSQLLTQNEATTMISPRRSSASSNDSAVSHISESDTDTSFTLSSIDETPISHTFASLKQIQSTGVDCISTLNQLVDKKALTSCTFFASSLDGGPQCCATVRVDGIETGIMFSTAFGYQMKAAKQKAASLLIERLDWFLSPAGSTTPPESLYQSSILACLQKWIPPPLSAYVMSAKQTELVKTAQANLQLLKDSTIPGRQISYVAIDIEAYDNPASPDYGSVTEIGICWLPVGAVSSGEMTIRHMIVAERQHLHNLSGVNAAETFAFGQSEVLPLAVITQEVAAVFEEANQNATMIYLVGWSFANDAKWLTEQKHFNVDLTRWPIQPVDVSMVWRALQQSLDGRKLGVVLQEEGIYCGTMHNAGNDACGTMELFWKIREGD